LIKVGGLNGHVGKDRNGFEKIMGVIGFVTRDRNEEYFLLSYYYTFIFILHGEIAKRTIIKHC